MKSKDWSAHRLSREKTKRSHVSLAGLLAAGAFLASVGTLLGFLGELHWLMDLFAHFRLQYAAGLLLCMITLCLLRAWRTALVLSPFLFVNLWTMAPYYLPTRTLAGAQDSMRAVHLNVQTNNTRYTDTVEQLLEVDADIIVLAEVDEAWMKHLEALRSRFPHVFAEPRSDNFGIALFSRWRYSHASIVDPARANVPAILAHVRTPHGMLGIVGIHTLPPVNARYVADRDRQLAEIPGLVDAAGPATLVLGDLNTTPWSASFRKMIRDSALVDCALGRGLQPTWPTSNWLVMIPIDHCLRTPRVTITDKRSLPAIGGDHLGSIVDFAFLEKPSP